MKSSTTAFLQPFKRGPVLPLVLLILGIGLANPRAASAESCSDSCAAGVSILIGIGGLAALWDITLLSSDIYYGLSEDPTPKAWALAETITGGAHLVGSIAVVGAMAADGTDPSNAAGLIIIVTGLAALGAWYTGHGLHQLLSDAKKPSLMDNPLSYQLPKSDVQIFFYGSGIGGTF